VLFQYKGRLRILTSSDLFPSMSPAAMNALVRIPLVSFREYYHRKLEMNKILPNIFLLIKDSINILLILMFSFFCFRLQVIFACLVAGVSARPQEQPASFPANFDTVSERRKTNFGNDVFALIGSM
jgi:hypothetical protein